MNIDNEVKLDYSDVLLTPSRSNISSRSQIDLNINYFDTDLIPIIAANMDGVGTFEIADALAKHGCMTALSKHYTVEELVDFYADFENKDHSSLVIYSMGSNEKDFKKFEAFDLMLLEEHRPHTICIDVANGYTSQFEEFVEKFSSKFPSYILMVGNVVTPEQTDRLLEAGADIVKIGIGPGSVCTTRKLTGVGYPQLSAVIECAQAAKDAGGMIVADGGITCPGDAAKAFAAGADMVMIGGYFAGHYEGGGVPCDANGTAYVHTQSLNTHRKFYGMASRTAQDIHNGGVADYRASEGKEVIIPFKGSIDNTIKTFLGGLRSAATYIGADSIKDFHRRAKFIRVNRQLNNIFGS
jgi:GMP reductase